MPRAFSSASSTYDARERTRKRGRASTHSIVTRTSVHKKKEKRRRKNADILLHLFIHCCSRLNNIFTLRRTYEIVSVFVSLLVVINKFFELFLERFRFHLGQVHLFFRLGAPQNRIVDDFFRDESFFHQFLV